MKNLIKGLVDNEHSIEFNKGDFYSINIDNGQLILTFEEWNEAEEVLLDYIINETNL